LKRCLIHWDDLGYSKGTADVEFETADEAKKAIKDYNGKFYELFLILFFKFFFEVNFIFILEAEIEGIPMKVEYAKNGVRRITTGGRSNSRNEGRRFNQGRNSGTGRSDGRREARGGRRGAVSGRRLGNKRIITTRK
jgi:RNA recognition motif-containing protein